MGYKLIPPTLPGRVCFSMSASPHTVSLSLTHSLSLTPPHTHHWHTQFCQVDPQKVTPHGCFPCVPLSSEVEHVFIFLGNFLFTVTWLFLSFAHFPFGIFHFSLLIGKSLLYIKNINTLIGMESSICVLELIVGLLVSYLGFFTYRSVFKISVDKSMCGFLYGFLIGIICRRSCLNQNYINVGLYHLLVF